MELFVIQPRAYAEPRPRRLASIRPSALEVREGGAQPDNEGIGRHTQAYQAALWRSSSSSIHFRDRWRNTSVMRTSVVTTSKSVRGPVVTGNAALSSRTPRT